MSFSIRCSMFRPSACASAGTYYSVSQLAFFRIFSLCSCQGAGCFFQGLNPENDTADSAFLFQALSFNSFPLTLCVFARPALWPSRSHSHASAASAAPWTDEFAWCLLVSAFAYCFQLCLLLSAPALLLRIDLGMSFRLSPSAVSLERR